MFPTPRIIRVPDRCKRRDQAQVIDVPMRSGRAPLVVRDARAHAARAERTANIDIEAGTHVELPKPPDLYQLVSRG